MALGMNKLKMDSLGQTQDGFVGTNSRWNELGMDSSGQTQMERTRDGFARTN